MLEGDSSKRLRLMVCTLAWMDVAYLGRHGVSPYEVGRHGVSPYEVSFVGIRGTSISSFAFTVWSDLEMLN